MPLIGGLPFFPQNYSRQDIIISESVLNFFCNFAKTGNPNIPSTSSVFHKETPDYSAYKEKGKQRTLVWEPFEVGTEYYLSISKFILLIILAHHYYILDAVALHIFTYIV